MYPKFRNFPISPAKHGGFILSCMALTHGIEMMCALDKLKLKLGRINDMAEPLKSYTDKRVCFKCDELFAEYFECDVCGFTFCKDHIINDSNKPDDVKNICESCLKERK